jgi:nucleoside phosphorylase
LKKSCEQEQPRLMIVLGIARRSARATPEQSRAVALDMGSGTVAANGFRFRVPYGTLLCVSDKPHGQLKLPGMADKFYRDRVVAFTDLMVMALLRTWRRQTA